MYKKLEILFASLSLFLSIVLFFVSAQIKDAQNLLDNRSYNATVFISKNDLLTALYAMGVSPDENLIKGTYIHYIQETENRTPTNLELEKIHTIQDYISNVGYATSSSIDIQKANQITNESYKKRNNYESWQTDLFVALVLSQFLALYFSSKKTFVRD